MIIKVHRINIPLISQTQCWCGISLPHSSLFILHLVLTSSPPDFLDTNEIYLSNSGIKNIFYLKYIFSLKIKHILQFWCCSTEVTSDATAPISHPKSSSFRGISKSAASETSANQFCACWVHVPPIVPRARRRVAVTSVVKFLRPNHGCTGAAKCFEFEYLLQSSFFNVLVLFSHLPDSQIWCFGSSTSSFVTMLSRSQTSNLRLRDHHRRSWHFRWPPQFAIAAHARNFTNSSTTCFCADSYYGVNVSSSFYHFQLAVICFVVINPCLISR